MDMCVQGELTNRDGRGGHCCCMGGVGRHRHGDNGAAGHLGVLHSAYEMKKRDRIKYMNSTHWSMNMINYWPLNFRDSCSKSPPPSCIICRAKNFKMPWDFFLGDRNDSPMEVVDGIVLVATIGATVAAATGVTVLKIDFCGPKTKKQTLSLYVFSCKMSSGSF